MSLDLNQLHDDGNDHAQRVTGRYCKDHAGMICQVGGFYWRGRQGKQTTGVWIDFSGELMNLIDGRGLFFIVTHRLYTQGTRSTDPGLVTSNDGKSIDGESETKPMLVVQLFTAKALGDSWFPLRI